MSCNFLPLHPVIALEEVLIGNFWVNLRCCEKATKYAFFFRLLPSSAKTS
jgi:hypothetical protein